MAEIPVVLTCPLGSVCEEIKDNAIHRCRWYVEVQMEHSKTKELSFEWNCAMAWAPRLSVEMSNTNRGQTIALESFRNAVIAENNRRLPHDG
jgi:hypothetical protein